MATVTTQDTPANYGPPPLAPAHLVAIRQVAIAHEDAADRMWHRQVPAWVISGAIHMLLMTAFLLYQWFVPVVQLVAPENQIVETKLDDAKPEQQNFENTDVGLDPTKETNY